MPIKYIGRTTDFKGKTLWEIVGNLKNFGVGRIVARSRFERYPEPSYLKILKVEAVPAIEEPRKVKVLVERTFRGRTLPKPVEIYSASYKADYLLIPKAKEEEYCKLDKSLPPPTILPGTVPYPPLLAELIKRDLIAQGKEPVLPPLTIKISKAMQNTAKIAGEGETPTAEPSNGLGKPASPELYKNI